MPRKNNWGRRPEPVASGGGGGGGAIVVNTEVPPVPLKARIFWACVLLVVSAAAYIISTKIGESVTTLAELKGAELPMFSLIGLRVLSVLRSLWYLPVIGSLIMAIAVAASRFEDKWIFAIIAAAMMAMLLPGLLVLAALPFP